MDTIQQTIRPYGAAITSRLQVLLIVAVLAVGLIAGFGLGRVGVGSAVAPAWSAPAGHGPGHVPRVWVHQP
jgi:hypothetical protein